MIEKKFEESSYLFIYLFYLFTAGCLEPASYIKNKLEPIPPTPLHAP